MDNQQQLQVGVKALLMNSKGEFLLLERNPEAYDSHDGKGMWEIPGGRKDPEESEIEGLLREIIEEAGIDQVSNLQEIASQNIPDDVPKVTRHTNLLRLKN